MLDAAAIRRLLPVGPDLFGVRSAACFDGDRMASIDPIRVADLAWAAGLGPRGRSDSTPSNGSDGITR
jgi:hypothetical protein